MASLSETVIHVRLVNEPIPVWRPVQAEQLADGRFIILPQKLPDFEVWEFMPGETVAVETQLNESGTYLRAKAGS